MANRRAATPSARAHFRIRKGDTVKVIAGKDVGKTGKVLKILAEKGRLIVEGVNFVKKHARRTREDRAGGIHQVEASIHASNVMLVCPKCRQTTRIGHKVLAEGKKARTCSKCGEIVDR